MLTFGMPTLIETATAEQAVLFCSELGLSFLELNTNFPQYQPSLLQAESLCKLAAEHRIGYTIHLNDEMPVADFNAYVAQGYLEATLETITLAKKIGASKLNMHLSEGAHYTMPDRIVYFYEAYLEQYLNGIRRFRDVCSAAVGDSGICICVENSGGYRSFQRKALEILLESPVFALTLDVGHNYCAGNADAPFILEHSDRLRHIHLHDAKDDRKDHLTLGTGVLDIPGYIDLARKYNCSVVLETKTVHALRDSVVWLKEYLRDVI